MSERMIGYRKKMISNRQTGNMASEWIGPMMIRKTRSLQFYGIEAEATVIAALDMDKWLRRISNDT
jgi:hypothetical protein